MHLIAGPNGKFNRGVVVLPGRKLGFGPGFGQSLIGKHENRLSGRPKAGRRAGFEAFPPAIRPKCGPEARFPARRLDCVT